MVTRPDPRSEPREYAEYLVDSYTRLSRAYSSGAISEATYRLSLRCLHWCDRDIDVECRMNASPESQVDARWKGPLGWNR